MRAVARRAARHLDRSVIDQLIDTVDAVFYEMDEGLQVTFVSQQAERMLGYRLDEWATPDFWIVHVHPDDRQRAVDERVRLLATAASGHLEYRMVAADGRPVWLRDVVAVIKRAGQTHMHGITVDVTPEQQAAQERLAINDDLVRLTDALRSARANDATRVARELHDELGTALGAIKWGLAAIAKEQGEARGRRIEQLPQLAQQIERAIATVQRVASDLRPAMLDDLGVADALEWQAREFRERSGMACTLARSVDRLDISSPAAFAIFRIVQQALAAVLQHEGTTEVVISMERDDQGLVVRVVDNGRVRRGKHEAQEEATLAAMRDRATAVAATVDVRPRVPRGSEVIVRVPRLGPAAS
jgi:two-component system sensor histidine kinase UhpB